MMVVFCDHLCYCYSYRIYYQVPVNIMRNFFFGYHQINIINYTKKCLNAFFCVVFKRKEKSCTFETLLTPNLRLIGNARSNWAERASRSSDWNANETPA